MDPLHIKIYIQPRYNIPFTTLARPPISLFLSNIRIRPERGNIEEIPVEVGKTQVRGKCAFPGNDIGGCREI